MPHLSSSRTAVVATLAVAALLIFLSAMVIIPPFTMALFALAVGAREYSPFLAIFDLLWCLPVNRALRGRGAVRGAMLTLLVIAALVAVRPLTQYTRVAAAAAEQIGNVDGPASFSLWTAIRGLPSSRNVDERTINYPAADLTRLSMRFYTPTPHMTRPVVIVIYGGAWRGGDPSQAANVSRALAARGYAVAAIDYRHAPQSHFPAQLDDIRLAMLILRDSADAWGIDRDRVAVLGRSSGGHLAELSSYAEGALPVKAVVALYAPYNLVEGYRNLPFPNPIDVRAVLHDFMNGTPEEKPRNYRMASPSSWVHRGLPPTLLVYAGRDHVVKPEFNRTAAADLRSANVPVVAVELPWAEHGFDLAPAGLGGQLAFKVIADFLDRELMHKF
ncbi:MAG: putative esterase/lipase/thioesterase [Gemmatimonadetes bacterium]|nr:putative esterase/lipase/thioesterase [Gemmatimonadota bacterium]